MIIIIIIIIVNTSKNNTDTVIIYQCCSMLFTLSTILQLDLSLIVLYNFIQFKNLLALRTLYAADSHVVGSYIKRREGPKRSAVNNVTADIISAILKLDQAGIVPKLAIDYIGFHMIPKVIPAATNALSMCKRMAVMESRIQQLEESMSADVCKTITMDANMHQMTS